MASKKTFANEALGREPSTTATLAANAALRAAEATRKHKKAVDELTDSMEELGAVVQDDVSDAMEAIAESIADARVEILDLGNVVRTQTKVITDSTRKQQAAFAESRRSASQYLKDIAARTKKEISPLFDLGALTAVPTRGRDGRFQLGTSTAKDPITGRFAKVGKNQGLIADIVGTVDSGMSKVGDKLSAVGSKLSESGGPLGSLGGEILSMGGKISRFSVAAAAAGAALSAVTDAADQFGKALKSAQTFALNTNVGLRGGAAGRIASMRATREEIADMNMRLRETVGAQHTAAQVEAMEPVLSAILSETGASASSMAEDVLMNMSRFQQASGKSMDEVGQLFIKRMNSAGKSAEEVSDELLRVMAVSSASARVEEQRAVEAASARADLMRLTGSDREEFMNAEKKRAKELQGIFQRDVAGATLDLANEIENFSGDLVDVSRTVSDFFSEAKTSGKLSYDLALKQSKTLAKAVSGQTMDAGYMSTLFSSTEFNSELARMTRELQGKKNLTDEERNRLAALEDIRNVDVLGGTAADKAKILRDSGLLSDGKLQASALSDVMSRGGMQSLGFVQSVMGIDDPRAAMRLMQRARAAQGAATKAGTTLSQELLRKQLEAREGDEVQDTRAGIDRAIREGRGVTDELSAAGNAAGVAAAKRALSKGISASADKARDYAEGVASGDISMTEVGTDFLKNTSGAVLMYKAFESAVGAAAEKVEGAASSAGAGAPQPGQLSVTGVQGNDVHMTLVGPNWVQLLAQFATGGLYRP